MVNVFYGAPYDVRNIEANLLSEQIANCIASEGKVSSNLIDYSQNVWLEEFIDHFTDHCSLNFNPTGEWEKTQYYVEVNFYDAFDIRNLILNMSEGNSNWKPDCELQGKGYDKLVVCSKKEFYAEGLSENIYLIKILTVVRKTEQNVK